MADTEEREERIREGMEGKERMTGRAREEEGEERREERMAMVKSRRVGVEVLRLRKIINCVIASLKYL